MGLVNQGLADLENSRQQQKNDPTRTVELRAMADSMEKTSETASKLPITDPEVRGLAQRYGAMARDISARARAVADAHEIKDLVLQTDARTKLNDALKLEDPLVDELNTLCSQ